MKHTKNKILYILLILIGVSFIGILLAFYIKEKNILVEQNSTPRVLLLVISCCINFLSTIVLFITWLTNFFIKRNLEYTKPRTKANRWFQFLYFIITMPYLISLMFFLETRKEKIEISALNKYGIIKHYIIDSVHVGGGKGINYNYYFKDTNDDMYVTRKQDILNKGDTILIKHLPHNLSVYREVN